MCPLKSFSILCRDFVTAFTRRYDQQIPLQHDDSLYLPVEMRYNLDASYDWLPKWKCLSTHESL
jgi:hypothetical protein